MFFSAFQFIWGFFCLWKGCFLLYLQCLPAQSLPGSLAWPPLAWCVSWCAWTSGLTSWTSWNTRGTETSSLQCGFAGDAVARLTLNQKYKNHWKIWINCCLKGSRKVDFRVKNTFLCDFYLVNLFPQKIQLQTKGRSPLCHLRWARRCEVFP